jgi:PilZ domain
MKFGRGHGAKSNSVALPARADTVTLIASTGVRLPARVLEANRDRLLLALMVPTDALSRAELDGAELEFNSVNGRVRLTGAAVLHDPSDADVVRIDKPSEVEVVQGRQAFRIRTSRPVLIYVGRDRTEVQSYTVDISGGGFLLAGPDWLNVGETLQFLLTLTPGALVISGTGKVVRIDGQGHRAIVFDEVSDFDRRRVVRFIFETQRTELARSSGRGGDRYGN